MTAPARESREGARLADWLRFRRAVFVHIPNRTTSARNTAHLKAQGLQPGFPDYLVFGWGRYRRNFALELKRSDAEYPRANQLAWLRTLRGVGFVSLWGTLERIKGELERWQ